LPPTPKQGRIQEFALRGGGVASPLSTSSSLLLPFRGRVPSKTSYGVWGSTVSSPSGVWGSGPGRKRIWFTLKSKLTRKPLVAIILSILKCMFYSCHLPVVITVTTSVSRPRGGAGPARCKSTTGPKHFAKKIRKFSFFEKRSVA